MVHVNRKHICSSYVSKHLLGVAYLRELAVVIPACNEPNLPELIAEWTKVFDWFRDLRAGGVLIDYVIVPVKHSGEYTYLEAIRWGVGSVDAEYYFICDADGQYSPWSFRQMWIRREQYDMIIGEKKNRADPFYRIVMSKLWHWFILFFFPKRFPDPNTGFRLMTKEAAELCVKPLKHLHYTPGTEITYRAWCEGLRIKWLWIPHFPRKHGGSRLYSYRWLRSTVPTQLRGLIRFWKEQRMFSYVAGGLLIRLRRLLRWEDVDWVTPHLGISGIPKHNLSYCHRYDVRHISEGEKPTVEMIDNCVDDIAEFIDEYKWRIRVHCRLGRARAPMIAPF